MRRLVVAPNWVGDCVMALPFLRALKKSDLEGEITVLCGGNSAPIFQIEGSASAIVVARTSPGSRPRQAFRLRRRKFDEAWVLPNSFRAALTARLTGARRRYGYASDRRNFLLTDCPARPGTEQHQLRDYDVLLLAGGVEPDIEPPRLVPPASMRDEAAASLDAWKLRGEGALIFMAPGAAFGETKRWSAERFALLADSLMDEGNRVAIVIGPSEVELGRLVARRARHRIPVLGDDKNTAELAAMFACGNLLVGNDSGPAHLAAAVGTRVLVIFGPTDPGRTRPSGATVKVLDRYVHCSPCFLKKCPYGHECMEEITVEAALAAARQLLAPGK